MKTCLGCHYGPPTANNLCISCSRYPKEVKEWEGPNAPNTSGRVIDGDYFRPHILTLLQRMCAILTPSAPTMVKKALEDDAVVCQRIATWAKEMQKLYEKHNILIQEAADIADRDSAIMLEMYRMGSLSILGYVAERTLDTAEATLAAQLKGGR